MLLRLFKILLRCGDLELPYVQLSPRADGTLSIPGVLFEFAPFPPHRGGRGGAGRGGAEARRPNGGAALPAPPPGSQCLQTRVTGSAELPLRLQPRAAGPGPPAAPALGPLSPPGAAAMRRWGRGARRVFGREAEGSAGLLSGGAAATCVVILF